MHHARHDTFFTQNSARFRLHKTGRRCRGLWVVCFLTLKLNMCLKIKPWLFHPPPEATRIKNSSDLSLLQNLDSQPSYTLFFISENYQLLSRSETSKIQRNFETYFTSVMFWQPSGNTTHQKFKWVRIVTKPGYIVSHLSHCLSSQKKKSAPGGNAQNSKKIPKLFCLSRVLTWTFSELL